MENQAQNLLQETKDRLILVKIPEITYKQLFNTNNNLKKKAEVGSLNFFETKNKFNKDVTEIEFCLNKEDKGQHVFNLNMELDDKLYSITKTSKTDKRYKMHKIDFIGRLTAKDDAVIDEITYLMTKEENESIHHTKENMTSERQISNAIIPLSEKQFHYTHADRQKAVLNFDRKQQNLKKTRKDRNELMSDLFQLFSEKSHWTVKSLKDKLDQPELYLKEVLNEICNYCKSGPRKGNFTLKEQFMGKKD